MRLFPLLLTALFVWPQISGARELTDALARKVTIPESVERVICSGSGCLRLLTYLQAQNMAVAVDDLENTPQKFDARPYAMVHPEFKKLPVFGKFHGEDDPELIMSLDPAPQVILKVVETGDKTAGLDPDDLQEKTGIPVVALKYGDIGWMRNDLHNALRIMGEVVGRKPRAEDVIRYFDEIIADLKSRTADIPSDKKPSVFIGGVAFAGPHGFGSTEPSYPPFTLVGARNLAQEADPGIMGMNNTDIDKAKIVDWDPDILFLDLSTLQRGDEAGGLHELKTDPAYQTLSAVRTRQVYGVLPYNWYNRNFESIFANAYFIGKLIYPDRFIDIDPAVKADEIFTFTVGKAVFADLNGLFQELAFRRVPLN